MTKCTILLIALLIAVAGQVVNGQGKGGTKNIYARTNLIAWCIVPFDIKERGPEERAQMLNDLGITKLAYDWRGKHIPTFDAELDALKKHNIELQGFWLYSGSDPETKDRGLLAILDVLKRHNVKTQLWCMVGVNGLDTMTQEQKIRAVAKPVSYIADKAAEIGCSLGLYNHGGWFGEPENQLAVIDYLKKPNIGIVYNFHHAEEQIDRFPTFFPKLLPYLMAINLSGLKKQEGKPAKVVPIGQGDSELEMMRIVKASGYRGPIGIINENTAPDAEVGLTMNMDGLKQVVKELGDSAALKTYK